MGSVVLTWKNVWVGKENPSSSGQKRYRTKHNEKEIVNDKLYIYNIRNIQRGRTKQSNDSNNNKKKRNCHRTLFRQFFKKCDADQDVHPQSFILKLYL